jgi:hypothetical protein
VCSFALTLVRGRGLVLSLWAFMRGCRHAPRSSERCWAEKSWTALHCTPASDSHCMLGDAASHRKACLARSTGGGSSTSNMAARASQYICPAIIHAPRPDPRLHVADRRRRWLLAIPMRHRRPTRWPHRAATATPSWLQLSCAQQREDHAAVGAVAWSSSGSPRAWPCLTILPTNHPASRPALNRWRRMALLRLPQGRSSVQALA